MTTRGHWTDEEDARVAGEVAEQHRIDGDSIDSTDCTPSRSALRQAAWTAMGWVALVIGIIVVLLVTKPGGC